MILALMALAWISIGWHFIWLRYGSINWAMVYCAPLFAVQSCLCAIIALSKQVPARPERPARTAAYGLVLAGSLAYPLLAVLNHRPITSAEVIGIAPDPTAVATLGATFLMSKSRCTQAIFFLSIVWLGQSALTLFVLDGRAAVAPTVALLIALVGWKVFPVVSGPRR